MKNAINFFNKYEKQKRIFNYDVAWKNVFIAMKEIDNSKATLSAVVERILESNSTYEGFIPKSLTTQVRNIDYGHFDRVPPPYRLNVLDGSYVSVTEELSSVRMYDTIADKIDSKVDCLVEFGSGLGINLARMRMRLPDAKLCYIACEPSENGRLAAKRMFSLDSKAELITEYFDYLAPDLDFLKSYNKIVAFTCHSIEQILVLGDEFYDQLLNTNIHSCIHCEPVGWQRNSDIYNSVLNVVQSPELHQQFRQNYVYVLNNENLLANAAAWAAMAWYNMDLLKVVSGAVERGDVTITDTAYDFVGSNPFNPSTLISWVRNNKACSILFSQ
ncbi:MAG: hypothetical protein D4R56_03145 [Deltaproteobacteria bacterium]|nr:MAG: hypothetical protein D4R56_03145 [Deltaproteobacteria bacterium]